MPPHLALRAHCLHPLQLGAARDPAAQVWVGAACAPAAQVWVGAACAPAAQVRVGAACAPAAQVGLVPLVVHLCQYWTRPAGITNIFKDGGQQVLPKSKPQGDAGTEAGRGHRAILSNSSASRCLLGSCPCHAAK
eukprot:scaffold27901_cov21-Tisochrysis_lutea.AAC.10